MVKGISRQVIVVRSQQPKLFEQAIFILRDDAVSTEGITEEALLREANAVLRERSRYPKSLPVGILGAMLGSVFTTCVWLFCTLA